MPELRQAEERECVMGFLNLLRRAAGFGQKASPSLEELKEMCRNKTLQDKDILGVRAFNIVQMAQELAEDGDMDAAVRLLSISLRLNPTRVVGEFLLCETVPAPENINVFKTRLDDAEYRDLFYRLYQKRLITNANIGYVDEKTQEKIDLAFHEGMQTEEKEKSGSSAMESETGNRSTETYGTDIFDDVPDVGI